MSRAASLIVLLATASCAEPLEFADWTIPVPEGTRTVEYAGAPSANRTERVELVTDLVIGDSDAGAEQ